MQQNFNSSEKSEINPRQSGIDGDICPAEALPCPDISVPRETELTPILGRHLTRSCDRTAENSLSLEIF